MCELNAASAQKVCPRDAAGRRVRSRNFWYLLYDRGCSTFACELEKRRSLCRLPKNSLYLRSLRSSHAISKVNNNFYRSGFSFKSFCSSLPSCGKHPGSLQAGAVRSRSDQRKATSDWMELEKQRGISITSTVLSFEYNGNHINLLDTPGHQVHTWLSGRR